MAACLWEKRKNERKERTAQEDISTKQLRQFQLKQVVILSSPRLFVTFVGHRTCLIHCRRVNQCDMSHVFTISSSICILLHSVNWLLEKQNAHSLTWNVHMKKKHR
uniref:Uncharacterized protein n=1 Tax=Rhipicephalus microplus TaxID=6941 RepID=A0A6G5AGA5_RHIMP